MNFDRAVLRLLPVAMAGAILFVFLRNEATAPPPLRPLIPEGTYSHTVVLPSFAAPIPEGKNAVWCATFQMAWDRLKEDVVKEPLRLSESGDIAAALNASAFPRGGMHPATFYAAAGRTSEGIAGTIRSEMKRLFPDYTPQLDEAAESALVAYAYLRASVRFDIPYFDSRKPLPFRDGSGNTTAVRSFGLRLEDDYAYRDLRGQVKVLYQGQHEKQGEGFQGGYGQPLKEFALDPCRTSMHHQLIIAKIPRRGSLAETWRHIEAKLSDQGGLGINEVFLAPDIRLATTHHFRELEGRTLLNSEFKGMPIRQALQVIQFTLNRGGAELSSESKILVEPMPRYFIVNGPFLVILRKRGSREPFFALWVEHPEVLEAWH